MQDCFAQPFLLLIDYFLATVMIRVVVYLLLIILCPLTCLGQKSKFLYDVSYFGRNITHPGISVSVNYRFYESNKSDTLHLRIHSLFLSKNKFALYYHKNNHLGLLMVSELAYQLIFKKGIYVELAIGVGYLRTFYDVKVFEVDNKGHVKRIPIAGANYFSPNYALGLGKYYWNKKSKITSWYVNLGAYYMYPFNTKFLINPYIQSGLTLNLRR